MNPQAFWLLLRVVSGDHPIPTTVPVPGDDPKTVRAAFELARPNGLFYAMAERWTEEGHALPQEASPRWRETLRERDALRRTIEDLNRAASVARRGYCLIKDYRAVENVPRDVDVLVREADQPEFLETLRSDGFAFAYRDEAEISLTKPGRLRVDVYGRIHYLRRDFLDPEYLFSMQRDCTTHGITHPGLAAEAALLLNSAHGLFGHAELTLLDFLDFRHLRTEVPNLSEARQVAASHGWGRVFDRWDAYLRELERDIYEGGRLVQFPARNRRRFILDCVDRLDGPPLSPQDRRALSVSLTWDQLVFVSETAGFARALRRSAFASFASNAAGHRLRILRGDRKGAQPTDERGDP